MKKRKMGGRESRKNFSRNAVGTKAINIVKGSPMRGGFRL